MADYSRPPSRKAACTETAPATLERWSIHVSKKSELWRYRLVLFRNPHNTVRGRHYLSRTPQVVGVMTDTEKAALDAEKPLWEEIRQEPPPKITEEERIAEILSAERDDCDDDYAKGGWR